MKNTLLKLLFGSRQVTDFSSKGLLVLRLIAGFGLILHGMPKMGAPTAWMGAGVPAFLQLLALISELGGGIAIILGILVPLASLGATITMFVGVVYVHVLSADPLYRITVSNSNDGPGLDFFGLPMWLAKGGGHSDFGSGSAELAILYMAIGCCLFFTGAGKYSIDHYINKGNNKNIGLLK